MNFRAQRFQPFLVGDAEMLLLVHHHEAEIAELDLLAEDRVGADDDIDAAVGEARAHRGHILGADQPRGLRDLQRKAAKAFAETS